MPVRHVTPSPFRAPFIPIRAGMLVRRGGSVRPAGADSGQGEAIPDIGAYRGGPPNGKAIGEGPRYVAAQNSLIFSADASTGVDENPSGRHLSLGSARVA